MSRPTMVDYVKQTPEVLRSQIANDVAAPLVEAFCAGSYRRVRIVACGSSRNGSLVGRHYLRHMLQREVIITEPYTFCAYEHELPEDEFCFVVSQSGYSTNALAALETIRAAGRPAIGLTGDPSSDFKDAADILVDYGVGEELVGYVTKGVTSFAFFLALFGIGVAQREGRLDEAGVEAEYAKLEQIITRFEQATIQVPAIIDTRYKELSSMERVMLVGAGANYGVACEGALKYGETLQIPAVGFELEEYLHGPNLQISPEYTIFFMSIGTRDHERCRQLVDATRLVTDRVFWLTDDAGAEQPDLLIDPCGDSLLSPAAVLPFFQISAWQLTGDKHLWHKHPLVAKFDAALSGKSENYVDKEVL